MLDIKILASGSKGNCYCLDDGHTRILLECGITFKEIQKGLDFETSKLKACIISHGHKDHCKGVKTLLERGIDTYVSAGTYEEIGITNHRLKITTKNPNNEEFYNQFRVGSWVILPFSAMHDTLEPTNYLLQSDYGHKVLFVTDSYYVKYNFSGISHFLIECNYDIETLNDNVLNHGLHPAQRHRVMRSHMSLETLLEFFKATDLSQCEKIYLLHLSDGNANRETIFREVAKATGKDITIVG